MFAMMTLYVPYQFVEHVKEVVITGERPQLTWFTTPSPTRPSVPAELLNTPIWRELEKLFEWCTEHQPKHRPDSSQLCHAIQYIKNGQSISSLVILKADVEDKIRTLQKEAARATLQGDFDTAQELLKQIQELKLQAEGDKQSAS